MFAEERIKRTGHGTGVMRNKHTVHLSRNTENVRIRYSPKKSFLCCLKVNFRLDPFETRDDPWAQIGISQKTDRHA